MALAAEAATAAVEEAPASNEETSVVLAVAPVEDVAAALTATNLSPKKPTIEEEACNNINFEN